MTPVWFRGDQSGLIATYVAANVDGCERGWDKCTALGVFDGRKLIAGVVYHDWNPESGTISMSCYAETPRWLTKGILAEVFGYPFRFCQMVYLQVSEKNKRMLRIAERLGCELIRIPRGRGRDEDEILCVLTDDAWGAFHGKA